MSPITSSQRTLNLLAIQKPAVTARLIHQVTGVNAVVVLDLEDSLWDVADPARTMELKARARVELLELARDYSGLFKQFKIGVRINKSTSPEFSADLAALRDVTRVLPMHVIVSTKVESAKELEQCRRELDGCDVKYEAIVPIVETRLGLAHLSEIASTAVQIGTPTVIYGHYDYSLDAGLWPFPEHDDMRFWGLVEPFISHVESAGLSYIHPPIFQMYDETLFSGVFGQLAERCRRPFGMLTLGQRQARLCANLISGVTQVGKLDLRTNINLSEDELVRQARAVQQDYESYRKENKGFAVDPHTGRFISPHQYAAALAFLSKAHA